MMSTVPALMVLYSNDAVEVRFIDGSCLQVAPCGSTFVHHESPKETIHPVHGMKSIHQRCQFSTSDYKQKVIQALDFRNRFAEQPFVCSDLASEDQVVPLYANVKETAWPKDVKDSNFEYLPDGGVRLISEDEFASLVLSPHKQDFTVCYLSRISEDIPKSKGLKKSKEHIPSSTSFHPKQSLNNGKCHGSSNGSHGNDELGHSSNCGGHGENIHRNNGNIQKKIETDESGKKYNKNSNAASPGSGKSEHNGSHGDSNSSQESGLQSPRLEDSLQRQLQDELCISPISIVSSLQSRHTSPENKQENGTYKRYSTPTEQQRMRGMTGHNEAIDIGGKKSAFRYYEHNVAKNSPQEGSFLETLPSDKLPSASADQKVGKSGSEKCHSDVSPVKVTKCDSLSPHRGYTSYEESEQPDKPDGQDMVSPRCFYSWITKHFSCDECPVAWRHPLNLARTLMNADEKQTEKAGHRTESDVQKHRRISKHRDHYSFSLLPKPLPLTCPSQHLHKHYSKYIYDQDKDLLENLTTFKQGKMKILMVDGVVYRILRLTSTKAVEIFPGDGTVILSQGVTGQYYRHIIPTGNQGKLEERSYSVKSLPPTTPSSAYSIQKLVKRANRFLLQANQEEKMLTNADICCWKPQPGIIEPMQSSLLEECTVPGHGRFSAHSNGYVRILFEDRTALDMNCDFSRRIEECLKHSDGIDSETHLHGTDDQSANHVLRVNPQFRQGVCKLLLPNGQYQVVDVKRPGLYRRYTDAALEWASWVNSSPAQRTSFYQKWQKEESESQLVAKELQKIKCFNYIVDNTVKGDTANTLEDSQQTSGQVLRPHHHHHHISSRDSGHQSHKSIYSTGDLSNSQSQLYKQDQSSQHNSTHPSGSTYGLVSHSENMEGAPVRNITSLEMLQGFHSVRQALLQTSKVINDIDDILDKRKPQN